MAEERYDEYTLLNEMYSIQGKIVEAQKKGVNDIFALQKSNLDRLLDAERDRVKKHTQLRLEAEQRINEELIKEGFKAETIVHQKRLALLQQQAEKLKDADPTDKKAAKIRKQYEAEKAWAEANAAELESLVDGQNKKRAKNDEKFWKASAKNAKAAFSGLNLFQIAFGSKAETEAYIEERTKVLEEKLAEDPANAGKSSAELKQMAKEQAEQEATAGKISAAVTAAANLVRQLTSTVNNIGEAKGLIDTRLQGSKNWNVAGSYWELMTTNVTRNVGMNPILKQSTVVDNLKTLVGKGIAYQVEQRAFLESISDKIATTFEATDSTLLKLVRIQQADTTAARLGMESALTAFLNSMFETTEYMTDAATAIRQSIYEASALMTAKEATAFEYQVQKWMGSLYSVGFSNAQGLADALGKLAAGDISIFNDTGYGNLLVMAANKANLSIAEILAEGLDDSETNILMRAMVEYLGDIYKETKNSKVVAQQFANVYGLTASDLKAAANLARSTNNIANNNMTYGGMINQLTLMSSTAIMRTSSGEFMTNLLDNLKYSMAESMASNPVLYMTLMASNILKDLTGGIDFAIPMYMGTGMPMTFNVADLMAVGAGAGAALGALGKMLTGLGSLGGLLGGLVGYGVDLTGGLKTMSRGTGTTLTTMLAGATTSQSGYVGNESGEDVQNQTMQSANESGANQVAEAKDNSTEITVKDVNENVVAIYELLQNVTTGINALHVTVDNTEAFPGYRPGSLLDII